MITTAILGAGIGREHLDGYRALPDAFRVKYICDLDEDRAKEIAGDDPIEILSSIDAVLADPDIDLVDVCLPPHLHLPVTTQVLKSGKHAICEKPMVVSLADADALMATASQSEGNFYPVFQYRYGKAMSQFQALDAAGLLGTPFAASLATHWCRKADYYDNAWRGTWAGENGGAVLGHAIHNHDLITCLMGPIARLSAFTTTRVNQIETEDCAAISMQMANGAVVTSSITLGAADDTSRLQFAFAEVTATGGSAPYAPMNDNWTFTARDPAKQNSVDRIVDSIETVPAGFTGFLAAIADDLSGRTGAVVTATDGRQSIELVAAIYDAARNGTVVALPLTSSHPFYTGWIPDA